MTEGQFEELIEVLREISNSLHNIGGDKHSFGSVSNLMEIALSSGENMRSLNRTVCDGLKNIAEMIDLNGSAK